NHPDVPALPQLIKWTCPGFVEGCVLGIRVSGLTAFCSPFWCHSFVRPPAEPFFHPGLHEGAAVARSGGQGRPHLGAARRACPWCARHGPWIGGASPLRSKLEATASRRQLHAGRGVARQSGLAPRGRVGKKPEARCSTERK